MIVCHDSLNLIKTDESGDSLWSQSYDMQVADGQQTSDGGYILGGSVNIEGFMHSSMLKTDAVGDIVWQQNYIFGDVSQFTSVQQTGDDGYIAAGLSHSDEGCWDYLLLKTDADGDTLWTRTYGRSLEADEAYAACQTDDGGYIITGLYFWTVKTDEIGDTLWTGYYGSGEIGCAFSIEQTDDGGYLLCGTIDPVGQDNGEFYIVKTDNQGYSMWELSYGNLDYSLDMGFCARQISGNNYITVGKTRLPNAEQFDFDIWMIKFGTESSAYSYLPGDANMYNGLWPPQVIGSDVTYLVNYFRGVGDACELDGFWASADANGDCNVIGSDVTRLVNYFRGNVTLLYCPDYEPAWHTPNDLPEEAPAGWPNCEIPLH